MCNIKFLEHEFNDANYEKGKHDLDDLKQENVDDPEGWEHDYDEYLSLQHVQYGEQYWIEYTFRVLIY